MLAIVAVLLLAWLQWFRKTALTPANRCVCCGREDATEVAFGVEGKLREECYIEKVKYP